ncbi:hypothetical protein GBB04_03540 [Bifidobacterium dentium]|uniref:Uncharacterized protein n=1 Tax=Bifidobacterium dentium TaxID=1689 RepID=A0A7J5TJH2_9BIFI|nr:hypothetical protein HMPREF1494_1649 [Bifidobacterium sp. MSTE12]KAB7461219.1 hypothetical protein GBA94_02440 [Bifidobacterium dentium]KAB7462054.1 hypothetical protein GBB04_03540 [Bifidobacterium dentium]KAB7465740.1 hypothetical protein GBB12_04570 [Bifidobacterium dentium]RYT66288.1 hypothetical protein EAI74_01365 [Bifidobacterium dentium]
MDDRTGGTWLAGKPGTVPKASSPCPGPLSGRSKTVSFPDFPGGWGGFSGTKVNVDIRTTIAHPDCHSKDSPGEALRPCYTVISRKWPTRPVQRCATPRSKPHANSPSRSEYAPRTSSRTMRAKASTNGIVPPSPASESNMNATDDRTE